MSIKYFLDLIVLEVIKFLAFIDVELKLGIAKG